MKVEVAYKNDTVVGALGTTNLSERLLYIIAEELTARYGTELECGKVDPEGISLRVRQCGRYDKLCRDADIEIEITAKSFPGRDLNLDTRSQRICEGAKALVQPWIKVYVVIWTSQAAFAQSYENPA